MTEPWSSPLPTIDEVAALLPKQAGYLLGTNGASITPATVRHVATIERPDLDCDVVTVQYSYMSYYRGEEVTRATTLVQILRGGLDRHTGEGWGLVEVYALAGALDERQAEAALTLLEHGLPKLVARAEL